MRNKPYLTTVVVLAVVVFFCVFAVYLGFLYVMPPATPEEIINEQLYRD